MNNSHCRINHGSPLFRKGNITFLVMMIMFISSLLRLLVTEYVSYMIKSSTLFQNYYKTYYMAYGGLEVGLTQVKYHGFGFEDTHTTSGSACRSEDCSVVTTITSRSSVIADVFEPYDSCPVLDNSGMSNQQWMSLTSGDCFITPLFVDVATGFGAINYDYMTPTEFLTQNDPILYNNYTEEGTGEIYSLRIIDENLTNLDSFLEPTTESPDEYAFGVDMPPYSGDVANYLIVANPTTITKKFCFGLSGSGGLLPMKFVSIQSIANDDPNTISLTAIKNNELPSFLCYGAINP